MENLHSGKEYLTMGDKKSKKDIAKGQRQKEAKQEKDAKTKQGKRQANAPVPK